MAGETAGPGFTMKVSPTGAGTYVAIARVRDISGPEQTVDTVETTNQDSPDNYKEWIPTLIDGGTTTFPMSYLDGDATQAGLLASLKARELLDFEIVIGATGNALFFSGYMVKEGNSFPVANVYLINVDIKITGPVTGPSAAI